jgi:uracil-DNA glycosylase
MTAFWPRIGACGRPRCATSPPGWAAPPGPAAIDAPRARSTADLPSCLGATAAKALISPSFRITKDRGRLLPWTLPGGPPPGDADEDEDAPSQTWMLATTHPSAILRTPDQERTAAYDALVADLEVVAHALA